MFHDRNLQDATFQSLAFQMNAQALRLALLVQWYKERGERTLPVQYLRRLAFTRRQWELATKGSRQYDGRKLLDKTPAKDGCEAFGIVTEHREKCPETGATKTYWVIGEVDSDALDAITQQRLETSFDVIEDRKPEIPSDDDVIEPSVKAGTQLQSESDYDKGYAHGEAVGYQRGVSDAGCVYDASLDISSRNTSLTQANEGFVSVKKTDLETTLSLVDRLLVENDELRETVPDALKAYDENPNMINFKEIMSGQHD